MLTISTIDTHREDAVLGSVSKKSTSTFCAARNHDANAYVDLGLDSISQASMHRVLNLS